MQKFLSKGLIVLGLLSQTLSAQYKNEHPRIAETIKKYQLQPLVDSPYFKENPTKLPYEKCKIYLLERGAASVDGGVIVSDTNYYNNISLPTLFCYSEKLRTAFKVPVKISYDETIGLTLGLAETAKKIRVRALEKKTLADIFGYYEGVESTITLGIPFGGSALLNKEKVALSFRDFGFGVKVSLADRLMDVAVRTLTAEEIFAEGMTASSPSAKQGKAGCKKEAYDRFWIHMTHGTHNCPPEDLTDLSYYQNLKFKHVRNIDLKFWTKHFWHHVGDGFRETFNPDF